MTQAPRLDKKKKGLLHKFSESTLCINAPFGSSWVARNHALPVHICTHMYHLV